MTHSFGGTGAQNDAEVPVTQCSSSSSSPSPVGASRRFSCDICGGAELAKYTCPACGVHTCSLPCQRQHKSSSGCPGVRSRCEFVRAEDMGLTTMCRCVALLCCMARAHFSHPPTLSLFLFLSLSLSLLSLSSRSGICNFFKMLQPCSTELPASGQTRTSKLCRRHLEQWETNAIGSSSPRTGCRIMCKVACRGI